MSGATTSVPLDVLVECCAALMLAKVEALKRGDMDMYRTSLYAWCRLSWRVDEMLAAQRVEVTS